MGTGRWVVKVGGNMHLGVERLEAHSERTPDDVLDGPGFRISPSSISTVYMTRNYYLISRTEPAMQTSLGFESEQ